MQLHRAVNDAEATSGLQICVVVCSGKGALGAQVDAALADLGVTVTPAVLVAVRRSDEAIEIVLGPNVGDRLDRNAAQEVLSLCPPTPGEDLMERAAAVVLTLADRAGPGEAMAGAFHVPDVIEV